MLQRGQDCLARRVTRPHHLDDDVDVFAGDESFDVVGEQIDRHTTVSDDPSHADAAQGQRRADPGGEIVSTVLDDANNFTAHIAQAQYRYTDRFFITVHASPHLQTQKIVDGLSA